MEISGIVIKMLPLQSGEGKNGPWQKQEFVIEVPGQFPKKVCFSLWGDKVTQYPLKEGDPVTLSFDLESREYKDRWYTEARVWKISTQSQSNNTAPAKPATPASDDPFSGLSENDIPGSNNFMSKDIIDGDDMPF